jgi:hypothetical protein
MKMIKGFKKVPTSETETNSEIEESNSFSLKENYLINNIWFIIFLLIFFSVLIFWISTEICDLKNVYGILSGKSKLSIIVNIYDKKSNLTHLLRSLMEQSLSSYELIITKNFEANYSSLPFGKLKRKNIHIKFIEYSKNDTNLKIKMDCASHAFGDYILFMSPEETFTDNFLEFYYNKATKEKLDIIQFFSFYSYLEINTIMNQPHLFDSMFFNKDEIRQTQYHLSGKIIKKDIFLDAMKDIDNYYFSQNNKYFDDSIILFMLFKKAESLIVLNKENSLYCSYYPCPEVMISHRNYSKNELIDILNYLKFLVQYSKGVQEQRMAAQFFIDLLVKKEETINNYDKKEINFLDEVINLYLNSEIINEFDKNIIRDYRKKIIVT